MLTNVHLTNIQAHEDLDIPLDNGINVILGPTNCGKSSVFRAIKWLVEHKPITGLVKHGADRVAVSIDTGQSRVVRFKDSEGYGYSVDGAVFLACASNQPLEVQRVLGLSAINLQAQHDPPFLLTLTPGQMARELNRIVDLSVIDEANSTISYRHTTVKAHCQALQGLVQKQENTVQEMAWISEADARLAGLEKMYEDLDQKKLRAGKLWDALVELRVIKIQQSKVAAMLNAAVKLGDLARKMAAASRRKDRLFEVLMPWNMLQHRLAQINTIGKHLAKLAQQRKQLATAKSRRDSLRDIVNTAQSLEAASDGFFQAMNELLASGHTLRLCYDRRKALSDALLSIADWMGRFNRACSDVEQLEKALEIKQKEQKLCPTCKKPL